MNEISSKESKAPNHKHHTIVKHHKNIRQVQAKADPEWKQWEDKPTGGAPYRGIRQRRKKPS